jgi:hypothetical protein
MSVWVYLLLDIRFDGPFTDPFFLFFFFFPLGLQGATSIRFRLSKQKLNYVDIQHAQNIIMVELLLLCLGQIISCDNLTLGKAYGINYEVHVTSPPFGF